MRSIIVILSIIILAVGVAAAVIFGSPYVDAALPRASVGEAVVRSETIMAAQAGGGEATAIGQTKMAVYVPIVLYPNGDASQSRYALDFGVATSKEQVEFDGEGLVLVPLDRKSDFQGPVERYRVELTRKLARQDKLVLVARLNDPALAQRITIVPMAGFVGIATMDLGLTSAQLDMAIAGIKIVVPAFAALFILWIITVLARTSSQPVLSASDRAAAAPRPVPVQDNKTKEYKAERDFWRDAVRQFLTDRRVDVAEADRMIDSIETTLKAEKPVAESAAKRTLVAKREG